MRLLRYMLALVAMLTVFATASAEYNPPDPAEPGNPDFKYTLTTRVIPSGASSTCRGAGTYSAGTSVGLYTAPDTNYRFLHWEDEYGRILSETASFNYTMPAGDITLIAKFEYTPSSPGEPSEPTFTDTSYLTFTVNPAGAGYFGSSSSGTYTVGTTQSFQARSNSDFRFLNWTCDGVEIGTTSTLTYTVPYGDRTIEANFIYDPGAPGEPGTPRFPYTLSVKANTAAAVYSLYGSGSYYPGEKAHVYYSRKDDFRFAGWVDEDGNEVSDVSDFYYTMPDRDVTLTVNFEYNPAVPGEPGTPVPDESVAKDMVAWPRFGMYDDTHVMILCETEGATIHYTLDGTDPTAASPVYSGPVFVGSNLLVKAIARKEGLEDSPIRSYQVTSYHAATPVFSFEDRKIVIRSATPDAIIRYTLDFSNPNEESEIFTIPFEPEENCRVKAYASKEGLTDSPISCYVYRRAEHTLPAPSFEQTPDGLLVIIPAIEGGTTYYEITENPSDTDPILSGTLYTEPIEMKSVGNRYVRAYTTHLNYFDSPIGVFKSEGYQVEAPVYDFLNPELSFVAITEGSEIRYTLDGSEPTEESTLYTEPLRLTADCVVKAKGFKENYAPSETVVFEYLYEKYQLPVPNAHFEGRKLILTSADGLSDIYYAFSKEGEEWKKYEDPLPLTEDCTVYYFARLLHYNDSETGEFRFRYSDYRVANPVLTYHTETRMMEMSCETEGAQIFYTTDGRIPEELPDEEPGATGTLYEGPVPVVGNLIFIARAFPGSGSPTSLFPSEFAVYEVDDQYVPNPEARYSAHTVILECEDPEADIVYAVGGESGASAEMRYTGPIPVSESCRIRFRAERDLFHPSETQEYLFRLEEYQEKEPILEPMFDGRKLILSQEDGALISLNVNGSRFGSPLDSGTAIDVTLSMERIEAVALASDEDRYDSEPVAMDIEFHLPPLFDYDGLILTITPDEADSNQEESMITALYTPESYFDRYFDYSEMEFGIDDFGQVEATVHSDHAFRSEPAHYDVPYFNDGKRVGVRYGNRLSAAFQHELFSDLAQYEYLEVYGDLTRGDVAALGEFPNLTSLCLAANIPETEDLAGVFSGSKLETVSLSYEREGLLTGMPRLTTVIWGSADAKAPENLIPSDASPNLLLWVASPEVAPESWRNVIYGGPNCWEAARPYKDVEGLAGSLELTAGYPFNAHKPIRVESISFTKQFNQQTGMDAPAGWETIVLPFTPDRVIHEREGEIQPFFSWDGTDYTPRPYWLYGATPSGWVSSERIKAGEPYLIAMPNHPDYIPAYNINGLVRFEADGTESPLWIGTEESLPKSSEWIGRRSFVGSYMPVEDWTLSLNNKIVSEGTVSGDHFGNEDAPLPFECFLRGGDGSGYLPVFSDWSGLLVPEISAEGILIETPAPGTIRLSSPKDTRSAIYTMTGMMVRTLDLKAGIPTSVDGLAKGLYLVAGRKIMVQ